MTGIALFVNSLRRRDEGQDLLEYALLVALITWAEQHPVLEKVCLQVFATNTRAIALYTSLGFKEEGRQRRDVKLETGVYVDVFLMAKFVK